MKVGAVVMRVSLYLFSLCCAISNCALALLALLRSSSLPFICICLFSVYSLLLLLLLLRLLLRLLLLLFLLLLFYHVFFSFSLAVSISLSVIQCVCIYTDIQTQTHTHTHPSLPPSLPPSVALPFFRSCSSPGHHPRLRLERASPAWSWPEMLLCFGTGLPLTRIFRVLQARKSQMSRDFQVLRRASFPRKLPQSPRNP